MTLLFYETHVQTRERRFPTVEPYSGPSVELLYLMTALLLNATKLLSCLQIFAASSSFFTLEEFCSVSLVTVAATQQQ